MDGACGGPSLVKSLIDIHLPLWLILKHFPFYHSVSIASENTSTPQVADKCNQWLSGETFPVARIRCPEPVGAQHRREAPTTGGDWTSALLYYLCFCVHISSCCHSCSQPVGRYSCTFLKTATIIVASTLCHWLVISPLHLGYWYLNIIHGYI